MKIKRYLFPMLLGAILGLSACKKNNDAPTVNLTSRLDVINASADTVNFYMNGTRQNSNSSIFPAVSTGYYYVISGQQNYQVKKIFNPASNTAQTLFSIALNLPVNQNRSLFIADETLANAFSTIDTLQAVNATADTCYIRFVNASPDAGSLDMSLGNVTLFKSKPFKAASSFVLVNTTTGASTTGMIPLKIFSTGSTTPMITDSVSLVAGYSYTFYSKGKLSGTGNAAFSVGANKF